jgi:hypothetical protein
MIQAQLTETTKRTKAPDVSEAIAAANLAELALRWRIMTDIARSAARRLAKVHRRIDDTRLRGRILVVMWTLRKLPYVRPPLLMRALDNLSLLLKYLNAMDETPSS